jgi:hypothetical protein
MNDSVVEMLRLVTSSLGSNYPLRVALGVSLGTFLKMLVHVLNLSLPTVGSFAALDEFAFYWFIVVATPLMFISVAFNRLGVPEKVLLQLNVVDAVVARAKFSASQKTLLYHAIANRYVHSLDPNLDKPPDLEKIFADIRKDLGLDAPA